MCYTAYFRHAVVESHFALVKHWGRSPQVQGCQGHQSILNIVCYIAVSSLGLEKFW